MTHLWRGVIREYAARLPAAVQRRVVTLGEGGTPLILAERLSERVGASVYVKYEGLNPTGSFKDRRAKPGPDAAGSAGEVTATYRLLDGEPLRTWHHGEPVDLTPENRVTRQVPDPPAVEPVTQPYGRAPVHRVLPAEPPVP